jgi:hypothetical protein
MILGSSILPPSLNKSIPRVILCQTFLCLTEFIEKVQIFVTPNEHIKNIVYCVSND